MMDLTGMSTKSKPMEKRLDPEELVNSLWWDVRIPKGKRGKFSIKHERVKPDTPVEVVNMRNAIMMGYHPLRVRLPHELVIQFLVERGHGLLMSDSFQERFMMRDAIAAAKGDVLVAGLGLGYVARMIADKPSVTSVTVVEIEPKIIDLVWEHVATPKMNIVGGDVHWYVKRCGVKYDFVYLDIWYGTGEITWTTEVFPLRRLAWGVRKRRGRVMAWAEETMLTQIEGTLRNIDKLPSDWVEGIAPFRAYRRGRRGHNGEDVEEFFHNIGSSAWERRWGRWL